MKTKIIELIKCFIILLYRRVVLQSHDSTKVDGIYLRMKNLARCPDEARRGWLRDSAPEFAYVFIDEGEHGAPISTGSAEQVAREILEYVYPKDPDDDYGRSVSSIRGWGESEETLLDSVETLADELRRGCVCVTNNHTGNAAMEITRL